VLLKAGMHDNVVCLLTPLTITDAELNRGLDILGTALTDAAVSNPNEEQHRKE
jgi:4-aminobutyrate aminotransferase-like enzyme